MDKFDLLLLPNEMIYQVCKKLPFKELSRLVNSSSEIQDICQGVLNKRLQREIDRIMIEAEKDFNRLRTASFYGLRIDNIIFVKEDKFSQDPIGLTEHKVEIIRGIRNNYYVTQEDAIEISLEEYEEGLETSLGSPDFYLSPWILEGIAPITEIKSEYEELVTEMYIYQRKGFIKSEDFRKLITNLVKMGYQLQKTTETIRPGLNLPIKL